MEGETPPHGVILLKSSPAARGFTLTPACPPPPHPGLLVLPVLAHS